MIGNNKTTATRYDYKLVADDDVCVYEIYSPKGNLLYWNTDEGECLKRLMEITGIEQVDKNIIEKWNKKNMYIDEKLNTTVNTDVLQVSNGVRNRLNTISTEHHQITAKRNGHVHIDDKRIETSEDTEQVLAVIIKALCAVVR